jgi:hypothetical protein
LSNEVIDFFEFSISEGRQEHSLREENLPSGAGCSKIRSSGVDCTGVGCNGVLEYWSSGLKCENHNDCGFPITSELQ